MRKYALIIILLVAAPFMGARTYAMDHSVNVTVGMGYDESLAVEFYMKQLYEPWFVGDHLEVRPFTMAGVTFWNDLGDRGYVKIKSAKWVKSSQTVWGLFGTLGLEIALLGEDNFQPFFAVGAGPAYISETEFVDRALGGNFIFNDRLALGVRFGSRLHHMLSLNFAHFSNAGIYSRNRGYNIYSLTYSYTF